MDLSIFLAKALGIYFIVISIAVLLNRQHFINIVNEMLGSGALMLTMYINVLILGILLVLVHNIWEPSWRIIITIIAWLILIKAILNLCFPKFSAQLTRPFLRSDGVFYVSILINLLIGILLCYYGFFVNHSVAV